MNSGLTQIHRKTVSAPMRDIVEYLESNPPGGEEILHFGEGRAYEDTRVLREFGFVYPYDPNSPQKIKRQVPRFASGLGVAVYVFNTLPPIQRRMAFTDLNGLAHEWIIAVRADRVKGEPMFDGVRTTRGTFQKSYTVDQALAEFGGEVIKKTSGYIILKGESSWTS